MVGQGAVTGPLGGVTNLTIGTSASESLESHENCDHRERANHDSYLLKSFPVINAQNELVNSEWVTLIDITLCGLIVP